LLVLALVCTRAYNEMVKFEWNDEKNVANFKKHALWFEEAQTVWADPLAAEYDDPDHSDEEDRFLRVGYSVSSRVLVVVFCERQGGSGVRLISARRATPKERKDHEKGI
jgi:uncharacterized protein